MTVLYLPPLHHPRFYSNPSTNIVVHKSKPKYARKRWIFLIHNASSQRVKQNDIGKKKKWAEWKKVSNKPSGSSSFALCMRTAPPSVVKWLFFVKHLRQALKYLAGDRCESVDSKFKIKYTENRATVSQQRRRARQYSFVFALVYVDVVYIKHMIFPHTTGGGASSSIFVFPRR